MESSWFGLEDAMDLLTTSRRLTCRSSRVVTTCALDSISIETKNRRARDRDIDRPFLPQQRSSFGAEPRRFQGIKAKSLFEDYCDFAKQPKSKFPASPFREPKPLETDSTDLNGETEDLRRKFQNVQEENLKLQAVIADLTQVNKRWQKYNNDRQIYVQKLLNTIQDQQEQLNQINERTLNNKQKFFENSSGSTTSSMSFESDIDRTESMEQKLKERVEVLEFQVKAHRDDWEAELNEKKQALQDKEVAEKKVKDLLVELQSLKRCLMSMEEAKKSQYLCHCCGHPCQPDSNTFNANHNRVYRTAVQMYPDVRQMSFPLVPNRGKGSGVTYIIQNDLVTDGTELKQYSDSVDSSDSKSVQDIGSDNNNHINKKTDSNVKDLWQITQAGTSNSDSQELSYSRSSTVPLVNSLMQQSNSLSKQSTPCHSEKSLNDETSSLISNQGLVTSFVQIPISKSFSAPERKPNKYPLTSRKSVDSIKFSSVTPPVSFISAAGVEGCDSMLDGTVTQTMEDVICPSCKTVFPPKMHLKFLDHFESCQTVKKN